MRPQRVTGRSRFVARRRFKTVAPTCIFAANLNVFLSLER